MAKHNQYTQANLGTVLPITPERIGGRHRIYQTVVNIQLPLDFHQGQDVYIWHRLYFKWLLLCSYGHEDHILPKAGKRIAYGGILQKV